MQFCNCFMEAYCDWTNDIVVVLVATLHFWMKQILSQQVPVPT